MPLSSTSWRIYSNFFLKFESIKTKHFSNDNISNDNVSNDRISKLRSACTSNRESQKATAYKKFTDEEK